MRPIFCLFALLGLALAATESPEKTASAKDTNEENSKIEEKIPAPVVKKASVEISGKSVPYTVTTGKLVLKKDDGKPRASIFHTSYQRSDTKDPANRPVMFAFNGGPGSSSVWLHIGVLGPKILQLPGDGTVAPVPPVRLADNPLSILDVCDLVFVDPVSTGYSRAEKDAKASEFHGLNEDIESVGDFVRRWINENDRWASPKFLLGESYGGVRVAGLSNHLQSRYGMSLNGVVLLSALLDFSTVSPQPGSDLAFLCFLPSYVGTAHFHGKIEGNRDELVQSASEFSFGEYAAALLLGSELSPEKAATMAAQLEKMTGIESDIWLRNELRLHPAQFRAELLRNEGKVIGRFDGRVAWETTDYAAPYPDYDPSYALGLGAFSSAMMDYLGRDLGYKEDRPYEIITSKVRPWRWDSSNRVVNVSDRLATAMRDNPRLKVLVMSGYTDLATPPEGVAHSLRHLPGLPDGARTNITSTFFDAGHMFYLNPPDLKKTRSDLLEFISSAVPQP